jgi:hypothetical protein
MSRGEACTAAGSQAEARTRSDDWTIIAEQAYEAGTLRPLAYRLGFCERTIVEREAELVALQDGSLTIKHPIRRANRLQSEIESSKREIVSIREQLLKPRPDVSERLAAERADLAKFEAELTALRASIGERTPTLAERHEIAGVENRLFYADANIAKLATHPHVPPHHPQTPSLVTMQELVLAHVEGVNVELVTQGTNRRGTPPRPAQLAPRPLQRPLEADRRRGTRVRPGTARRRRPARRRAAGSCGRLDRPAVQDARH